MGLRDILFNKRENPLGWKPGKPMPAILEPDDPVNIDSVVDWMAGLSDTDYKQITKVIEAYREADDKVFAILGNSRRATTFLKPKKISRKQVDGELDMLLETDPKNLKTIMSIDHKKPKSRRKATKND